MRLRPCVNVPPPQPQIASRRNSVNAVTGTNRSRRAHDSHSVAGLRTNTRVRHRSNFRQSTRGGAAQSANTTIAPRRAVYGSAPGDGGGDDTRSGHLISCRFQFRRLEIPSLLAHSNAHARQPRTLPPSDAGGDNNNIIYTNFKWSRRGVGTRVFPNTYCTVDACPVRAFFTNAYTPYTQHLKIRNFSFCPPPTSGDCPHIVSAAIHTAVVILPIRY